MLEHWQAQIQAFDDRRDIVIPGDAAATIAFAVEHWVSIAKESIRERGKFVVALSGGRTPEAIYHRLGHSPNAQQTLPWDKVFLFWSDERSVPFSDLKSNYRMAMDAGLKMLGIPKEQIFRMPTERELELSAIDYEKQILQVIPDGCFDLVMLGMGEDGHIASLFPKTHALEAPGRLAVANYVPQEHTWRMTLTFDAIHCARHIALYIVGKAKGKMVNTALNGSYQPVQYPVQRLGTQTHKALWIMDHAAAEAGEL